MFEELLVRHCSPTLAGIKTGSMFTCPCADAEEIRLHLRRLNRILSKKGLRLLPLRFQKQRALVYVYRSSQLSNDLQKCTACGILRQCGYRAGTPETCLKHLIRRMNTCDEFPHEIGLFLGYPPDDVRGFIENNAKNCKYTGCWKVYGNVSDAQRLFAKYKQCTDMYCMLLAQGMSVERLTAAG